MGQKWNVMEPVGRVMSAACWSPKLIAVGYKSRCWIFSCMANRCSTRSVHNPDLRLVKGDIRDEAE